MSLVNNTVENHLRFYLERTRNLWKVYNEAMNRWLENEPQPDGAPFEGAFPEVGITHFSRHGFGIRIDCGDEIVEFDFIPQHIKKKDYLTIDEIDIYWSFVHYKSLHPGSGMSEEEWNAAIDNLHQTGVLTRFTWNRCAFAGFEMDKVFNWV